MQSVVQKTLFPGVLPTNSPAKMATASKALYNVTAKMTAVTTAMKKIATILPANGTHVPKSVLNPNTTPQYANASQGTPTLKAVFVSLKAIGPT